MARKKKAAAVKPTGAAVSGEKPEPKTKRSKKQPDLPAMTGAGVESVDYPEINAAADQVMELGTQRSNVSSALKTAKGTLREMMHSHKLTCYEFDGKVVTLKPKDETETVVVRKKDDDETEVEDAVE